MLGQGVINLRTLLHHKADWDERPLAIHAAAGGAPVPGPFDAGVVGELTVSLIAHAALPRALAKLSSICSYLALRRSHGHDFGAALALVAPLFIVASASRSRAIRPSSSCRSGGRTI